MALADWCRLSLDFSARRARKEGTQASDLLTPGRIKKENMPAGLSSGPSDKRLEENNGEAYEANT